MFGNLPNNNSNSYRVSEWCGDYPLENQPHWSDRFTSIDQADTVAAAVHKNAPLDRKGVEPYFVTVEIDDGEGLGDIIIVYTSEGKLVDKQAENYVNTI